MEKKKEIVVAKVCVRCKERKDISEGEIRGVGWICHDCLDLMNSFLCGSGCIDKF